MLRLLIYWVISAISLIASAYAASGMGLDVEVDTQHPFRLMLGVAVLGLVNATVGTIAKLVTAPLNCLTFGLFWLLINSLLFWWVGDMKIGFWVGGFWSAVVGSLLMGLVLGLLRRFVDRDEKAA